MVGDRKNVVRDRNFVVGDRNFTVRDRNFALADPVTTPGRLAYVFTNRRISTFSIKPTAMKNIIVDEPP